MTAKRKLKPFEWGHGTSILEIFLEPTCPFSAKAFAKIDSLISAAGSDRIKVIVRFHSQPWHMFSGIVLRSILAASTLDNGRDNSIAVMKAIYANREEFEFINHCGGPNLNASPNDIIKRIFNFSGCDVGDAFQNDKLQNQIKWYAKYARQNGVHISPTFMINGLISPKMSSGDEVDRWKLELQLDN